MAKHPRITRVKLASNCGFWTADFQDGVLVRLDLPAGPPRGRPFRVGPAPAAARPLRRFLQAFFAGKKRLPRVAARAAGSPFQSRVWSALRRIAPGSTRSYREVARRVRRPRASRAVGGACGANPLPLLIPCHRVTAHGGGLGGFSAGLPWKKWLLKFEGAEGKKQASHVRGRKKD